MRAASHQWWITGNATRATTIAARVGKVIAFGMIIYGVMQFFENRSAIKPKQAEIEVELLKNGPVQLIAGKVTFRQLAQHAKDNIYVAAIYDDQETK